MKKRLTIGLIVGATVFAAVFAAAASLGVTSDDLAAGSDLEGVGSCDPVDGVDVTYTTDFQSGEYQVTDVNIADIHADCDGQSISVTLTDGGVKLTTESGTLADPGDGTHAFTLTSPQSAEAVDNVHVVISGPDA